MDKITIKNLIDFRSKSDKSRLTLMNNLKKEKKPSDGTGGHYWMICLSAVGNAFKYEDINILEERINHFSEKIKYTELERTQKQYRANIDIIEKFQEFDFQSLKPIADLNFLKQPKVKSIINIKGLPIETKPSYIFTYTGVNGDEVGGVWFVAQKNGYKKSELAMYSDMTYRYLSKNYSSDYYVNPDNCIAVDMFNVQDVNYSEIANGNIPILIDKTIDDINKIV